jgi:hypothetical protein
MCRAAATLQRRKSGAVKYLAEGGLNVLMNNTCRTMPTDHERMGDVFDDSTDMSEENVFHVSTCAVSDPTSDICVSNKPTRCINDIWTEMIPNGVERKGIHEGDFVMPILSSFI